MTDPVDITAFKRRYRTRNEGEFPQRLVLVLEKDWDLRYGENPNQHGAIYTLVEAQGNAVKMAELVELKDVRTDGEGKGGLSLTNTMDITRAMDSLKWFSDPAFVIMKHNIVSGFSKQTRADQRSVDLFRLARDADLLSNFGGTLVFNRELDMETAFAMYELEGQNPFFVDVVAAPSYAEGVVGYIMTKKKDIRIARFKGTEALPRFIGDDTHGLLSIKEMPGGKIGIQDVYLTSIRTAADLVQRPLVRYKDPQTGVESTYSMNRGPSASEIDDMLSAWWINITGARSNGVVAVRDGVSVAMGSGQVARVEAVRNMIIKGMQKAMDREHLTYDHLMGIMGYERLKDQPFKRASVSSDAFFPDPDSLEELARVGVAGVVQPYGSRRDHDAIIAANKYGMAMPATGERCFGHF